MIMLEGLRLKASAGERTLFEDLSLQVHSGDNWAILGPNGAGKTTLLHQLADLRTPEAGYVLLKGQPIDSWPRNQRALEMGILLQDEANVFPATVLETVLTGRHPHMRARGLASWLDWESDEDLDAARNAIHSVGLEGFESRRITTLSGGEWRRTQIAALLAQNPAIYLADEPANHLDLHYQSQVLSRLSARTLNSEQANIFVLHDVNQALRYCDKAILMFADGHTQAGELSEMLDTEILKELYRCDFYRIKNGDEFIYLPA